MINSPFLKKKYRLVMQNFLFIEYYKKLILFYATKAMVLTAAFFIEKGIVEGLSISGGRAYTFCKNILMTRSFWILELPQALITLVIISILF
jgi:hypothetical protein